MKKRCWGSKHKAFILAIGMVLFLLTGCGQKSIQEQIEDDDTQIVMDEQARKENMESQRPVQPLMKECGLSNLDVFWQWALDKEAVQKKKKDTNSRMTAFLLMEDLIQADSRAKYGAVLKDEIKDIKEDSKYESIQDSIGTYIAVFDEVSVASCRTKQEYKEAYLKAWQKRNVTFTPGEAHLISVVMHDPREKKQYIGHAGVMLEDNKGFLFIEKRAPFKLYQISYFVNRQELQDSILGRKDYITDKNARAPFLLEDDALFDVQ